MKPLNLRRLRSGLHLLEGCVLWSRGGEGSPDRINDDDNNNNNNNNNNNDDARDDEYVDISYIMRISQ